MGGGSLPGSTLPTTLLAIESVAVDALATRLRVGEPPVVARVAGDRLLVDPRTVLPGQEQLLLDALIAAITAG